MCSLAAASARRECGIGIAVDDHPVRLFRKQHRLDRDQHSPGHLAMAAAIDIELVRRRRNIQFPEKHVRHVVVEVLTGMDHHFLETVGVTDGAAYCSCLDELRARTDNGENLERHPA